MEDSNKEAEFIDDFSDLSSFSGFEYEEDDKAEDEAKHGDELIVVARASLENVVERKIPEDFFYEYEDLVSKPAIEGKSDLSKSFLTLFHSYGYDCTRRANLCVVDPDTVVFMAGNYLVILNIKTKDQVYIRSTGGRGIGAISVTSSKKYIAVGEKGNHPDINVFEYPSLKLYRILRAGAEKSYTFLDFSSNASLLASVGGEPDYMLTLWNWRQEMIVLRCKAFSQDVFRATFSGEQLGQLTSSGVGHIRFWKMARTFTGLKLQGSLGRFGKREISDIEGYVQLPDGKVLSGCESGNMLIWDGGLCINEISRKGKKTCHQGPIQQINMDEGELVTIGVDGYIRVWDFETTGSMLDVDEGQAVELEPVNELKVGSDSQLVGMVRASGSNATSHWYAQDSKGGIWRLDLSFQFTSFEPERCMYYHSGPIFACGTSSVNQLVATVGNDCSVRVYDYSEQTAIAMVKFNNPATAFLWLPSKLDKHGGTMFAGFDDGVIRLLCLQKDMTAERRKLDFKYELKLIFAIKPHKSAVTCIEMNKRADMLVTGSSDGTVFFFDVSIDYAPIGFVQLLAPVNRIIWSPAKFIRRTILVSCANGKVFEIEPPLRTVPDTSRSYLLADLEMRHFTFESIKSKLRHQEELARLAEIEAERKKLLLQQKARLVDEGLWGPSEDEEAARKELEYKQLIEQKWEPEYPEKPSSVLSAFYSTQEGQFWVSMGDFDTGYFYECRFHTDRPDGELLQAIPAAGTDDVAITYIIFSRNEKYAIMGMQNGNVRIQLLEEPGNFATIDTYWDLGVHDADYGEITHLCLSFDEKVLFTVGLDGNFFSFHTEIPGKDADVKSLAFPEKKIKPTQDIGDSEALSIEDAKQKSEYEKLLMLAEKKKESTRNILERMKEQFQEFRKKNNTLPQYLRLNKKEFQMNAVFAEEMEKDKREKIDQLNFEMLWTEEKLKISLAKLQAKYKDNLEHDKAHLKSISSPHVVANYRLARRSDYLKECLNELRKNREEMLQRERQKLHVTKPEELREEKPLEDDSKKEEAKVDVVLKDRILKLLAIAEEKRQKRAERAEEWRIFRESRMANAFEDPVELAAIEEAKANMGDYNLKTASDYVVTQRLMVKNAQEKVILHKLFINEFKYNFNARFLALRNKKLRIINQIRKGSAQLQRIHPQIPRRQAKTGPAVPNMNPEELPEKRYEYTKVSLQSWYDAYLVRKAAEEAGDTRASTDGPQVIVTQSRGSVDMDSERDSTFSTRSLKRSSPGSEAKLELSDVEKLMKKDDEIRLIYDQDVLVRKMNEVIRNYDAELRCLRHEKFRLDISMKVADARKLVLLLELMLLKDLEMEENLLIAKVNDRVTESNEMRAKMVDFHTKIDARRKDIEYLQGQEKALNTALLKTINEDKFGPFLTKVFKKKIRRAKVKLIETEVVAPGDDSESDSETEDDEEFDESEEDEEDDDDDDEYDVIDLDVCPSGCDPMLYARTCALREDRLDIEEGLAAERKARDNFIKELEIVTKSANKVEAALDEAEKDLEVFQLKKQQGLNSFEVTVILRLHQIEYLREDGSPIFDFGGALVFEENTLLNLQKRIRELLQEHQRQKKQKRDSHILYANLTHGRRLMTEQINAMKEECDEMMRRKFGRIVSIEKLEQIVVNKEIEELHQQFTDQQQANALQLFKLQEETQIQNGVQLEKLKWNTILSEKLAELTANQAYLEKSLDGRERVITSIDPTDAFTHEAVEHQNLLKIVNKQVDEINELKQEIWAICQKNVKSLRPHKN